MTSAFFTYNKQKVIQALRYHFITRREIKLMMILVNVFALLSAGLFFLKKISPFAFLISSMLWFTLMILFWFVMPYLVYRNAGTFRNRFRAIVTDEQFRIENEQGGRNWPWHEVSNWIETPHFYHIYFNARSFFIVPKDAFEDEDVHLVRNLLKEKVKK